MNIKKLPLVFLILIFCLIPNALAQQPQPTPTKILKIADIEFKGLKRFKQENLIEEMGLQIGQIITPEMVDEAAARLNESGRFTKFGYRFRSSGEQVFITFEVEELRIAMPVVFDNFVWFTEEDLWLWLKKEIPSFDGTAPSAGNETERIRKSLERLLKEKEIKGSVEYTPFAEPNGNNPKHIFSVKGITLTPCRVRFAGAIAISEKDLISNSQDLLKGEYSRSFVDEFAKANLKPLYRKIGHLRVKFSDINARLADESVCSGVIVSMKVDEGVAYNWDGAVWTNNKALSMKELDEGFGITVGEIADGTKIDKGFVALDKIYSRKGYLGVRYKIEEDFDDDGKKVSYRINVLEGTQYQMGTLTIKGLPADVVPRLQESWKLKAGDVYDALYLKEFIEQVLIKENSLILLLRNNPKIRQFTTVTPNVKNATVDVTLEFKEEK